MYFATVFVSLVLATFVNGDDGPNPSLKMNGPTMYSLGSLSVDSTSMSLPTAIYPSTASGTPPFFNSTATMPSEIQTANSSSRMSYSTNSSASVTSSSVSPSIVTATATSSQAEPSTLTSFTIVPASTMASPSLSGSGTPTSSTKASLQSADAAGRAGPGVMRRTVIIIGLISYLAC